MNNGYPYSLKIEEMENNVNKMVDCLKTIFDLEQQLASTEAEMRSVEFELALEKNLNDTYRKYYLQQGEPR